MEKMERLFEASVEGNTRVLLMLLQKDPLLLYRVTLNHYDDMPLHVASMLGHADFVNEILTRKPELVMECDSQRRLSLHLASAKGHVEIVKALVLASPDTCLARDRDEENPLHLAFIKGHVEVVKELLQAQSHAARAMVQQDTIFHLCVKHNQLESMKLLLEAIVDHEFLNSKDAHGNTILHLAVADKQVQAINFLLLNTTIEVNPTNKNGETPMDILAQVVRDLKYHQIMQSLTRAGAIEARTQGNSFNQYPTTNSRFIRMELDRLEYHQKSLPYPSQLRKRSTNNDDWLDRKRSSLMVVASLIETMAFQAGINPPSGIWQDDSQNDPLHKAGYAIMVSNQPTFYQIFLVCNTVGFVSTLSIILLLISGLPFLKHRVFLWVLMVILWIATTSMSMTYFVSICVLTPQPVPQSIRLVAFGIIIVWIGLMTLLVAGHTIWLISIATRRFRKLVFSRKRTIYLKSNSHKQPC